MLTYISSHLLSTNIAFKSLEKYNVYVNIKLVDVMFATLPMASPWTESIKNTSNKITYVNSSIAIDMFYPHSVKLQSTKPHDHAMILTSYEIQYDSANETIGGLAFESTECTAKSVSIVKDNYNSYTAHTMAHELGHSLGCDHDGEGNSCSADDGYTMRPEFLFDNKNRWIFSSCSADYIKKYIKSLDRDHNDCLLTSQNHSPNTNLTSIKPQWFGQLYNADEQCRLMYGPGSYVCRSLYYNNFTTMCLDLSCYDPVQDQCFTSDGTGDGTPCADGKWCMSGFCVNASKTLHAPVLEHCPFGDQTGVVRDGKTCSQLLHDDINVCYQGNTRYQCCGTCAKLLASPTLNISLDQQCEYKERKGSYFCRRIDDYLQKNISSTLCSNMYCAEAVGDMCNSYRAEDKTTCGDKMWCKNGTCIYDKDAPAVQDGCITGDLSVGKAMNNLTCAEIKRPENQWLCYYSDTRDLCCESCSSIKRNIKGCEYGDKMHGCISRDCRTYTEESQKGCCETCRSGPAFG